MTKIQPPINQAANDINRVIQTIENICVPIAEQAIISAVPALGLPVVKQITQAIEKGIADYVTKYIKLGATFIVIDIQKDSAVRSMSDALSKLIAAEKTGDINAIQKAIAEYQQAQSALVKNDGSADPSDT